MGRWMDEWMDGWMGGNGLAALGFGLAAKWWGLKVSLVAWSTT